MSGYALPHCVGEPLGSLYSDTILSTISTATPLPTPPASRRQLIARNQNRSRTSATTGSTESLSRQVCARSRRLPLTKSHVDAMQKVLQEQARKRTAIERVRLHRHTMACIDPPRGAASVLATQRHQR
ncbi:hypothetical protein Tsp_10171 [Trichinella spiralis]|uniref:hypothetical protein n=1 Tax=Trichinella spiralis TaxID=6334 RepID=UPI0001EFDBC7|nr:hypothetical protein Tsp_10171 [Trichinella spiralis]